jgi:gentisate 1,2-dioxygenase
MIIGGAQNPVIQMEIYKSFNGRPYALLTDTTVNYSNVEKTYFSVPNWIELGNKDDQPGYLWCNLKGR